MLFTIPTMWPPALYHHYYLSVPAVDGIRGALEAFSVNAYAKHEVSVCRPGGSVKLYLFLFFFVAAQERGHYISSEVYRDVAFCHLDSTCAHVFGLQPEELSYAALRQFCCLFFCRLQDIPSWEAFSTEILHWEVCYL